MRQASGRFRPVATRVRPVLRLLPLPLSIALCLPAMADDKPDNWDLCPRSDTLPHFDDAPKTGLTIGADRNQQPTDIEGDELTGTEAIPQYLGNVALKRGDQFLGTDSLKFDTDNETYVAQGNIRYQDGSIRIMAERAEGNQATDTHRITDIRYQLVSRRGNGVAESVDLQGTQGELHRSTYSTCDPDQRAWELRARQIDVDSDEGFGVARSAVLHLGRMPVLYMPWFKFPIDDRRSTGLLYPALSYSSRNGFDYRQPIYLNLAPNYDATLYPRYMSKRGFMLDTEFRYLYEGGRGETTFGYMPNDNLRDRDRGRFVYSGYHNIDRHWQARANIAWVSDERFMEDFSNRQLGVSASNLQSSIGVYGTGESWSAGLMADRWQLTDYTLTEAALPYNRMPRAFANWDQPFGRWFQAGVYAEAVRFEHDDVRLKDADFKRTGVVQEMPGGNRFDIKPYVSMPLHGAAWYITPTLAWRYTAYQLEGGLATSLAVQNATNYANANGIDISAGIPPELIARFRNTAPSRSLPIASLDAGLYFDRDTKIGDTKYLNTLEPRLFYLNTPYRDQSDLPLFDTRPFTFSWGQLFRDNRYSGADRQTDANQLTMALTTRLIRQDDGREKLSVSAGQIRYFDDTRVTVPGETPVERGKSAWIADANYAINDHWTLGASYQWDPKYRREDLASLRTRFLIGNDGIINLSYRYRRNLLEQADFSFLYPISPSWSAVGRYYYSFGPKPEDRKALETIAGVQWDSCCLAVRVLARRYVRNRKGELNNSLMVEFELKGLGSAGQNTGRTLRRAILGYYRDDLYLVPPSNTTPNRDEYDPNLIP